MLVEAFDASDKSLSWLHHIVDWNNPADSYTLDLAAGFLISYQSVPAYSGARTQRRGAADRKSTIALEKNEHEVVADQARRPRFRWHLDSTKMRHQAALMRTTLTLDPDLAKKLKDLAHQQGKSFKETVNEVVRRGLAARAHRPTGARYAVAPHRGGFRPGIDPGKLNQLVDQLEVEEFIEETSR